MTKEMSDSKGSGKSLKVRQEAFCSGWSGGGGKVKAFGEYSFRGGAGCGCLG